MKKLALLLTAAATFALVNVSAHAEQKDLLIVVLEEANGTKSIHQQLSPHESCSRRGRSAAEKMLGCTRSHH
jgi:hypothetical protein